ncbi:hypothetical protein HN512_04305 [Candidatus Peregrinibacteria bacterium]|jgi:hypothetical protein|nr:hypothetical protein [Candidatus Peregrinibacteria bacterium]MBT3599031.1 hypothetical protein [Candidatus Peregrinibacteria bacterium]MBT4367379.1 hypothetical protein [Candidatus Peregrinibacteria bacterium]MBT4586261.1 hypothetical protein [Candidatus Peregrinibacteria bacterium]MBT6730663.1 hypothetical protein [Candidatus Peregrinibacteria bacterium]
MNNNEPQNDKPEIDTPPSGDEFTCTEVDPVEAVQRETDPSMRFLLGMAAAAGNVTVAEISYKSDDTSEEQDQ